MKRILPLLTFLIQFNLAFTMSGSGTSGDPYLVSSASELNDVRNNLTAYYKQTQDINISSYSNWTPIGATSSLPFTGTYDGDGHKITGLTITSKSTFGAGLFGYNGGNILNLGVSGSISGMTNGGCGLLAGYNFTNGNITNCYSEGSVSSSSNYVGGLVGGAYNTSSISKCYSTATVTATGAGSTSVGGFIGTANTTATPGTSTISECYSTGNVSNANDNSGNKSNTGGFAGSAARPISNCYSTGNVSCGSGTYVGGFCGFTGYANAVFTNCYSTGSVTSSLIKGGFVGFYHLGSFSDCFFDKTTSGLTAGYGGYDSGDPPTGITGKTTTEMQTASTFSAWSTSIWSIANGSYPILLWQIPSTSTFTGTGDWSEVARWSNGLPGSTTNVTISGTCTVDANYTVAALTITSGYDLHIDPGHILTITGTLTNSAGTTGLILESDATGTGMLMNNSTGVDATVEQYLKKYQWHFMGIPVTGVPDVNVPLHGCYVIWIDESDAYDGLPTGWQYLASGNSMKVLGGYAVRFGWDASVFPKSADTTITFSGILNTGVQDTIFSSETEGWNFISNPYPVTMDWDASGGKTLTNTNDAFYLWNPNLNTGNGDYGSYGSYISGGSTNGQTQYIPPMQGFFIQVWNVNSAISFNDACKVAVSTPIFCDAGSLPVYETYPLRFETATSGTGEGKASIKLAITSNGLNYDETLIRVNDNATDLFDGHFDAAKLKAIDSKQSQIYSVFNGIEYSINTLPEFTEKTVIPIRIMINETGTHILTLKELNNRLINCPLTLYNHDGKALANLSEATFDFEGQKGEMKSFYLGLGTKNAEEIVTLHSVVEKSLSQWAQLILKPEGQGAFAVQQRPTIESKNSIQSSIR